MKGLSYANSDAKRQGSTTKNRVLFHATSNRIQWNLAHVKEAVLRWRHFSIHVVSHIKKRRCARNPRSQNRSSQRGVQRATCNTSSHWRRWQGRERYDARAISSCGQRYILDCLTTGSWGGRRSQTLARRRRESRYGIKGLDGHGTYGLP